MSSPSRSNKDRLAYAFDVAERELGIAKLLDPEDVDVENPDEKSVMTYVAQFLHKYADTMSQQVIFTLLLRQAVSKIIITQKETLCYILILTNFLHFSDVGRFC